MITLNELKYVNAWTSKCPYPGVEYATLAAKKLVESYEDYKKHNSGAVKRIYRS